MTSPDLATERTSLLNGSNVASGADKEALSLAELEEKLYADDFRRNDRSYPPVETIQDCVSFSYPSPQGANTALIILLCLRRTSSVHSGFPEAIEERDEPIPQYERYAFEELAKLLKSGMEDELDAVLWSSYHIRKGTLERQSVIGALFELPLLNKSWLSLTLSNNVSQSVMRVWKRGIPHSIDEMRGLNQRVVVPPLMRRIATPRALHLSELLFFIGYLMILAHYILDPPHRNIFNPSPPPDWRTALLIIYAISDIAKNPWSRAIESYLTLISFLFALPSTPGPADGTYTILIFSFAMYFVRLHLPSTPSPMFLTPRSRSTPLSVILMSFVANALGPVVSFFMPAIFIAMFLLSISLSDVFIWVKLITQTDPAPVNARIGFFALFCLVGLLVSSLLVSVLLISHSVDSSTNNAWDLYGSKVGLQTRRCFLEAVNRYSTPLFFPAPLNLLHAILIQVPCLSIRSASRPGIGGRFRFALWTFTVLPVTFVAGVAWAWGLAQSR